MKYTLIPLIAFTTLALTPHADAFSLKRNGCKASITIQLPEVDLSCDTRSGVDNPSTWFNPNSACNLDFSLIGLPSLGDIIEQGKTSACHAVQGTFNEIKGELIDDKLNAINEMLPTDIFDNVGGSSGDTKQKFEDEVINDINNDIKDHQNGDKPNQKPFPDDNSDVGGGGGGGVIVNPDKPVSDDLCFSTDEEGNIIGTQCGETLAQQIKTSSMSSRDIISLEKTTLPPNCYESITNTRKYQCRYETLYASDPKEKYRYENYKSLPQLQNAKSDSRNCFIDHRGRSLCTDRNGNGSINYNQGYKAAKSSMAPSECKLSGGVYTCPSELKLEHNSTPSTCRFTKATNYKESDFYTCSNFDDTLALIQDEFGCYATGNNQRACIKPIDNWKPSYGYQKSNKSTAYDLKSTDFKNTTPPPKEDQSTHSDSDWGDWESGSDNEWGSW